MNRFTLLFMALFLSLCLLCGCEGPGRAEEAEPEPINRGETYLDGAWYLEEETLHIGYNLFPNGGGFLFIGETVIPIRYGVFDGYLYVSDNGNVESFPIQAAEDGLWIDGMLYQPVAENPEASAAVESMREAQQESSSAVSEAAPQTGKLVMQLITLAAAVGVVVILVQFFRKRRKS